MAVVGDVVLPGDEVLCCEESSPDTKILLGPGLRQDSNSVIAVKPGIVRGGRSNTFWVESHEKRYIPAKGDNVIGVVISKSSESYRLDIGASEPASLSYLAFEGASKRNKPEIKIDDLVFARLLVANKDMEPELVCIDSNGKSGGLGVIKEGGFMLRAPSCLARKLLADDSLLKAIGKTLPFEFSVGLNGRIWVKGRSTQETVEILKRLGEVDKWEL